MHITLTVDQWCVLPVFFPSCHRYSSKLNLLHEVSRSFCTDQLITPTAAVAAMHTHIASRQSLACARYPCQQRLALSFGTCHCCRAGWFGSILRARAKPPMQRTRRSKPSPTLSKPRSILLHAPQRNTLTPNPTHLIS
jgi:hypothetical protein